jgi:hypothetical protein
MPFVRHDPLLRYLTLTIVLGGCGPKTSPAAAPAPVVFEDRLVISDTDDRSPLRIASGQLPPPGGCRLWYPGRPLQEQPKIGNCAQIEATAPGSSWVLYRPPQDPRLVHVRVIDPDQAGLVTQIRVYDAAQGTYLGSKERSN